MVDIKARGDIIYYVCMEEYIKIIVYISQALAQAGIGCNVVAGTVHDHLFVPAERAADAMAVLQALQEDAAG